MPHTSLITNTASSVSLSNSATHTQPTDTQRNNCGPSVRYSTNVRPASKTMGVVPLDLAKLPTAALAAMGQHLSPREIGRLGQTCKLMRRLSQRMMRNLTDLTVAHHVARNTEADLNALPTVCVRLTGQRAQLAASALQTAPWVTRLDLRELKNASAIDIIALAGCHPNAQIALTPAQVHLLLSYYLHQAVQMASINLRRTNEDQPSDIVSNPFVALVRNMPLNLVKPCALAASTTVIDPRSTGDLRETSTLSAAVRRPPRCWSSDSLSRLAVALLARSEREATMPSPTRLFLATEALRTFPWHSEVSAHQRLLLLCKIAYALSQQIQNHYVVRPLLICLAQAIDLEQSLKKSSLHASRTDSSDPSNCVAPEDILENILDWGIDPHACDTQGLTAADQLRQRYDHSAAAALDAAIASIQHRKTEHLRIEQRARSLYRTLCVQS